MTSQSKLSFIAGVLFTLLFGLLPYHFAVMSSGNSGGGAAPSSTSPIKSSVSDNTPAPESESVDSSSDDALASEPTTTSPTPQPPSQQSYYTPMPAPQTPFNSNNGSSTLYKMQAARFRMLAQQMDDKIRNQQESVRKSSDRMGQVPSVTATMEYNTEVSLLHTEESIRDGYLRSAQEAEARSQQ